MKGIIFNIMHYSINDGPGIRTTVFLKGCPLKCKWCHNPESIISKRELMLYQERCIQCGNCLSVCDSNAVELFNGKFLTNRVKCIQCGECIDLCYADARIISGSEYSVNELMIEIEKDRIFYDESNGGVTFSGGEPLFQSDFLLTALQDCKNRNINTAVDTSGFASASILEKVSRFTDIFLYDLKIMNDYIHKEYTGVSNHIILSNLKKLVEWNKYIIVRVPLIPGVNDNIQAIKEIGEFVSSLKKIDQLHILPYNKTGIEKYARLGKECQFNGSETPKEEEINLLVSELSEYISDVTVGG